MESIQENRCCEAYEGWIEESVKNKERQFRFTDHCHPTDPCAGDRPGL
jgi:hypothetical protein